MINFAKGMILNPTENIEQIFNRDSYEYVYLFPILYGVLIGINNAICKEGLSNISFLLGYIVFSVIATVLIISIIWFSYSWLMSLISFKMGGIASYKMTFVLFSYSFIPVCIGAIFILLINLIVLSNASLAIYIKSISQFLRYFQLLTAIWALYFLIIGSSIINRFSKFKAGISSVGLILLIFVVAIIQKFK